MHIAANCDHTVLYAQLQIVEHNAETDAIVAQLVGQLLEQHIIGNVAFDFDFIAHPSHVFDMVGAPVSIQLVNKKLYGSRKGNDGILRGGMHILEPRIRLQHPLDIFLDLLVVTPSFCFLGRCKGYQYCHRHQQC